MSKVMDFVDVAVSYQGNHSENYTDYDYYTHYYEYPDLNYRNYTRPFNTSNDTNVFILPWWRQLIWSILFGGMVIVATGGNLIVIWIVLVHKRMRTVTNYFIVNLSIADAMVSALNVTFNYTYMLNSDWPFGRLYCKISQFVAILSICASVFTLMAIAIDRYMAIMNPLKPRMGKRTTICIAIVIWIIGIVISCPMLVFFTTYEYEFKDKTIRIVCYSDWPDGVTNHSLHEYLYNIAFMILTYVLPIASMTYTYTRVGFELWGSQSIGECTQRQLDNIKSKRRIVKMMIVVVLIFAICWLPFHIYFIITSYYPEITNSIYIQEVYLGIYWLAMSNSMYNPIIYCWMNSRFRRGFKQFFRWLPFIQVSEESFIRRGVHASRYSCSGSPDHHRIVRNDTERSFLFNCSGSPKHQRIQGGSARFHYSTQTQLQTNETSFPELHLMTSYNEHNLNQRSNSQKWTSSRLSMP